MSADDDEWSPRARRIEQLLNAAWGVGARSGRGWRDVWHSPPGAIFGVSIDLDDGDTVSARLWGWDRDLTDQVTAAGPVPFRSAGELVTRVAAVVEALTPTVGAAFPPLKPRPSPIPGSSPLSTSAAVAARTGGYVAPPLITDEDLRALVADRWPASEIVEVPGPDRALYLQLRPFGSSRVTIGGKLDRGSLGASAFVGRYPYGPIPGHGLHQRSDERGATRVVEELDSWLRRTMPPSWILERPVVEDYG